jgi:hypothetical protein
MPLKAYASCTMPGSVSQEMTSIDRRNTLTPPSTVYWARRVPSPSGSPTPGGGVVGVVVLVVLGVVVVVAPGTVDVVVEPGRCVVDVVGASVVVAAGGDVVVGAGGSVVVGPAPPPTTTLPVM